MTVAPSPPPAPADPDNPTAAELALITTHEMKLVEWSKGEAIVKQLIASMIPDSLFIRIRSKLTASDIWTALSNDFEKKLRMVSVDLRRCLQDERANEKDDLRVHFDTLRMMRENLSAMGHPPSDDDFYAIILGSLPSSYDPYISAVTATSSVLGKTLGADDLMLTLTEEYECRALKSKGARGAKDVAFWVNDKNGKGKSKRDVECFNCKKRGHYKADCWAPGGGKEGQGPKGKGKGKAKEKASVAKDDEKSEDAAWMAMAEDNILDHIESGGGSSSIIADTDDESSWFPEDSLFEDDSPTTDTSTSDDSTLMPDLQTVSDSDSEDDNLGEEDTTAVNGVVAGDGDDAYTLTFEHAFLTEEANSATEVETELYDSGAS